MINFIKSVFFVILVNILEAGYYENNFKLVRTFTPLINQEWDLKGGIVGGKFAPTLEKNYFIFYSCKQATIDEARKLTVDVLDYIIHVYNDSDPKLLNLSNYPYTTSNIEIYIHFLANQSEGDIKYTTNIKNRIFFQLVTPDNSYKVIKENFEEDYFRIYGKKWDPFKYGECYDKVE